MITEHRSVGQTLHQKSIDQWDNPHIRTHSRNFANCKLLRDCIRVDLEANANTWHVRGSASPNSRNSRSCAAQQQPVAPSITSPLPTMQINVSHLHSTSPPTPILSVFARAGTDNAPAHAPECVRGRHGHVCRGLVCRIVSSIGLFCKRDLSNVAAQAHVGPYKN